ncbi:membrane protein [Shewanella fidelis]|uniref:membrane protein n=1 Tax=Shewanella fidelis TaxID=173509 RepID=UPI0004B20CEE|nr:membrane protein [Shewanella fidelis]
MDNILFWLGFYLAMLVISTIIGYSKGNVVAGALLGYVLGPIGVVLLLFSKDRRMLPCPDCGCKIHRDSYLCPQCKQKVFKRLK